MLQICALMYREHTHHTHTLCDPSAVAWCDDRCFDVGEKWTQEGGVPDVNYFSCYYTTPPRCADIRLRLSLARKLLMQGHGRWRAIPLEVPTDHLRRGARAVGVVA
eukprot:COSAG01_NODE_32790_length_575_cov_1.084034_2_plen_106_part_00